MVVPKTDPPGWDGRVREKTRWFGHPLKLHHEGGYFTGSPMPYVWSDRFPSVPSTPSEPLHTTTSHTLYRVHSTTARATQGGRASLYDMYEYTVVETH